MPVYPSALGARDMEFEVRRSSFMNFHDILREKKISLVSLPAICTVQCT
jgi:hypothetical protein